MSVAWNVLAAMLRALGLLATDPAWGTKGEAIARFLALGALALERGEAGRADLEKLAAHIDTMVAQGREPTEGEWADLRARSDAAHAILQEAAKGDPTPEPESPADDSEGGTKD